MWVLLIRCILLCVVRVYITHPPLTVNPPVIFRPEVVVAEVMVRPPVTIIVPCRE